MKENAGSLEPTAAVLVAAGLATRMGGDASSVRKPFLVLEGLTLLEHACSAFDRSRAVREIVVVGHPDDLERIERMRASCTALRKVRMVVPGGELRFDSVWAGVEAVGRCRPVDQSRPVDQGRPVDQERAGDQGCTLVAIHDVARPLIETATIDAAIARAGQRGAAIVAIPMTDTVKTSSDGTHVESTLDRSVLWCAQTPQVFRLARFKQLMASARSEGFRPTDDAALHERYAGPVSIVHGSSCNLKITTPADLALAASILRARPAAEKTS